MKRDEDDLISMIQYKACTPWMIMVVSKGDQAPPPGMTSYTLWLNYIVEMEV